nr:uncharacterized protein LOC117993110 [Maniola hyperantus]
MTEEKIICKSFEEQKLHDIRAKLDIAKLVIKICLARQYDVNIIQYLLIKKASQYFSSEIITQLHSKFNTPKTFNELNEMIKMSTTDDNDLNCYDDKLLRNIILQSTRLPTKVFFRTLKDKSNKSWDQSQFEISMKTRGYKSKTLPRCTKSIIIEDPELSFERIKYLQRIQQFRTAGVPIIYIEEKITSERGCFFESLKRRNEEVMIFYLAVSSSLGMISSKHIRIPSLSKPVNTHTLLLNWILESVVPYVSTSSVFVLEDKPYNLKSDVEPPTMYSSRTRMMNWLEQNDIPHNPNMHSAELFNLVKGSSRNLLGKSVFDDLMSYGHKILLRPRKTQYLNYFNILWVKIFDKSNSLNMDFFNAMTINNWKRLEIMLREIEEKTIKEDIQVNKTIGKIFTFAEHEPMPFDFIKNFDDDLDEFKMEKILIIDS